MSRNKPGSESFSLPNTKRGRPGYRVTLTRALWERLDAEAKRRGVKRSRLIETAVEQLLAGSET